MLADVETVDFFFSRAAQTVPGLACADCFCKTALVLYHYGQVLDCAEEHNHPDTGPNEYAYDAENLNAELCKAAGIEEAGFGGEQTAGKCAPDAVCEVYADCADGVIEMKLLVEQVAYENNKYAGNDTDYGSADCVNDVAACGYAYKTCKGCVEAHADIGLLILYPGEYHAHNRCNGGCYSSREEDVSELAFACCSCAVETVPAEPEDEYAERAERERVALNCIYFYYLAVFVAVILADARAEEDNADKRCKAAYRMYAGRTCKVDEVNGYAVYRKTGESGEVCKPAVAPYPACLYGINHERDDCRIDAVRDETGTFCHCAGNYGCGSCAEHKVEYEV